MKLSRILKSTLVIVMIAGATLAYVRANPTYSRVIAAPAPAIQVYLAAEKRSTVDSTDVDNVTGIRFEVRETPTSHVVTMTPNAPEPQHVADMTNPATPVYALVRYESFASTTDFPLTQVGSRWIVIIPKSAITTIPGDRFSFGVWEAGANTANPAEAAYWSWFQI